MMKNFLLRLLLFVFTKNIVVDLLTLEKFKSMEIAFFDEKRLDKTYEILEIISTKLMQNQLL